MRTHTEEISGWMCEPISTSDDAAIIRWHLRYVHFDSNLGIVRLTFDPSKYVLFFLVGFL